MIKMETRKQIKQNQFKQELREQQTQTQKQTHHNCEHEAKPNTLRIHKNDNLGFYADAICKECGREIETTNRDEKYYKDTKDLAILSWERM